MIIKCLLRRGGGGERRAVGPQGKSIETHPEQDIRRKEGRAGEKGGSAMITWIHFQKGGRENILLSRGKN